VSRDTLFCIMVTRRCLFALPVLALGAAAAVGIFEDQSDVGSLKMAGTAEFGGGVYRVSGGGANIWANADAFHFVWKKASGDVSLSADIGFEGTGVAPHRKAGLMIRQSLDADAPYADVMIHGDGLTSLQYRESPGGLTKELRSKASKPRSVTLERRGAQFTMRVGEEIVGPVALQLQDPVYAGLAVCSHDDTVLETALFRNVIVR
jgi:TolB protein